jgi:hypothetical protein
LLSLPFGRGGEYCFAELARFTDEKFREIPEEMRAGDYWFKEALAELNSRLADLGYGREALEAVRRIEDEEHRAETLARLAPHLSEPLKHQAQRESLDIVRATESRWVLIHLAPGLPETLLAEAVEIASGMGDEQSRAEALAALAPYLQDSLLREAFDVLRRTISHWHRTKALIALLKRSTKLGYAQKVLDRVRRTSSEDFQAEALESLAEYLPESLLPEALDIARTIKDEANRAKALAGVTTYLPESLLPEALDIARTIKDVANRAKALAGIAPYLNRPLIQEAEELTRTMEDHDLEALPKLACRLAELGFLQEGLELALAPDSWGHPRSEALAELARYLPESSLREAMVVAVQSDEVRERFASRLAELGFLQDAIHLVRDIDDYTVRCTALAELSEPFAALLPIDFYPLWRETLHFLADRTREDLLADLTGLGRVLMVLGGPETVMETARAIQDVGLWWP